MVQRSLLHTLDQVDERLRRAQDREQAHGMAGPAIWLRRAGAVVAGVALIAVGIPMLVLPGPGVLSILLGLSLLAGQFPWARRLLASLSVWLRQRVAPLAAPEVSSS
jgi:hypothetical protein